MTDRNLLALAFEQHRDHLRAVAYRLLGSISDADDAVQDTWMRLTTTDAGTIENLGGWLTTVVARVSLNMLRTRRHRKELPIDGTPGTAGETATTAGPPGSAAPARDPADEAVLAESVGLALLVVLDTLTPPERLAFVLRDMFGMPFTDVAAVLGRAPEAARQLASRARRRVRQAPSPDRTADIGRQRKVAAAYLAAARGGDLATLVTLLDPAVRLAADASAAPSGRPVRLQGVELVSRGAVAASNVARESELALVNGAVGILYAPAGRLRVVLEFVLGGDGRITHIDVIADPERLRHLRIAVLAD
jgi:RNA polymerase sigma factor (sigma-70 family)